VLEGKLSMQLQEYIQNQFISLHQSVDDVLQNLTQGQMEWRPPGLANPIGPIFLHMLNAEDFHIQTILQGKKRLWETESWGDRIGLVMPPGQGRYWDDAQGKPLELAHLLAYQSSVRNATGIYLDRLTPEKVNEKFMTYGGEIPAAQVLAGLIIHLAGHAGEIASLLGMQGTPGLPY